jgi:glutathione peroxidase
VATRALSRTIARLWSRAPAGCGGTGHRSAGHGSGGRGSIVLRSWHDVAMATLKDFSATSITGEDVTLADYAGQVVLVVNTASQCGFTPQYKGLQELQDTYADKGFTVLGFPCDQFGHQEPGSDAEIGAFCEKNFGVTFPLFSKIEVNGSGTHPLYEWLKGEKGGLVGSKIKWNFTKYLLGRDGEVIDRYAPTTKPDKITADIDAALAS